MKPLLVNTIKQALKHYIFASNLLQMLYVSVIQMADGGLVLDPGLVPSGPWDIIAPFYRFHSLK